MSWDEALRPPGEVEVVAASAMAESHNDELAHGLAIAKSHGVTRRVHDFFQLENCVFKEGGDGQVYRARTLKGGKPVVLKFVWGRYLDDEERYDVEATKKLWREVTILRSMVGHPNIVNLLGTYLPLQDGKFALVHAFEEADTDLALMLNRRPGGALSETVAKNAACQIAAGLSFIHLASVIHRDIKPDNILVYLDRDPCRYVLADFGRARTMPDSAPQRMSKKTVVSKAGIPLHARADQTRQMGTARYDAPEIFMPFVFDDAGYGFGIDVWAFGSVVFQMVTGQPFINATGCEDTMSAVIARLGECSNACSSMSRRLSAVVVLVPPTPGVSSLDDALVGRHPSLIHLLQEAFRLEPSSRTSIVDLCKSQWLSTGETRQRKVWPASQLSSLGTDALTQPSDQPRDALSLGSARSPGAEDEEEKCRMPNRCEWFDMSNTPRPRRVTPTLTSTKRCHCSRRCKNPGHSVSGPGCMSKELVEGSDVCVDCVCSLQPLCLKPRYNGSLCYKHDSFFQSAPWTLKMTHALGEQGSIAPLIIQAWA